MLTANVPYATKDFAPVQLMYRMPTFLYVPASSPANSISEVVAWARKKPGGLSYASQGLGTSGHLGGSALQALSGAQFVHIPYKGSGQAMVDLAAGRVDMFFSVPASAAQFVKAGTVKVLAVAAATRSNVFPDVPTTVEKGFPELVLDTWFGLFAPAGTPQAIVNKLNEDFRTAVSSPDITKKLTDQNFEPTSAAPAEIITKLSAERIRFEKAFKAAGILKE
jgi:tripartite-type tricarboxylate transporter receptor subunit TctC